MPPIDETLMRTPALFAAEMRRDRLDAGDEAEDVDVELAADLLRRTRLDRAEGAVAGIVEPHVDPPEGLDRLGDRGLRTRRVLHVERDKLEPRRLFQVFFRRRVAHRRDDVPTLVDEEPRCRLADAAAGAGDHDDVRPQVSHWASFG